MAEEGGVLHRCGRVDSVDWREHNEGMIHTLFTYGYTFFHMGILSFIWVYFLSYGYTFFTYGCNVLSYGYTFFTYGYTFFHMGILSLHTGVTFFHMDIPSSHMGILSLHMGHISTVMSACYFLYSYSSNYTITRPNWFV